MQTIQQVLNGSGAVIGDVYTDGEREWTVKRFPTGLGLESEDEDGENFGARRATYSAIRNLAKKPKTVLKAPCVLNDGTRDYVTDTLYASEAEAKAKFPKYFRKWLGDTEYAIELERNA